MKISRFSSTSMQPNHLHEIQPPQNTGFFLAKTSHKDHAVAYQKLLTKIMPLPTKNFSQRSCRCLPKTSHKDHAVAYQKLLTKIMPLPTKNFSQRSCRCLPKTSHKDHAIAYQKPRSSGVWWSQGLYLHYTF